MDKFEKQLLCADKEGGNTKRMDMLTKEANKDMRNESKYYKIYKEKLIKLNF